MEDYDLVPKRAAGIDGGQIADAEIAASEIVRDEWPEGRWSVRSSGFREPPSAVVEIWLREQPWPDIGTLARRTRQNASLQKRVLNLETEILYAGRGIPRTMQKPSDFPRRILLAVSGLTPQIVTETLYALTVSAEEKFVPTEIHLLSTREGANRAKLLLLSKNPGWFHRLCVEYGLNGIAFPEANIHVVSGRDEAPMADIRTAEDNQFAADFITEQVRNLTSDPNSAVHVSLAGGRKTMGFYAGYALSLFGREQDRLSHVLAPEDFEFASEFFYPTIARRVIEGKDRKPLDTSEATLMLADIPFVRMRHGLPDKLIRGASSYSAVVNAASAKVGPPELTIDQAHCRIRAAGKVFSMTRSSVAMLSIFARCSAAGKGPMEAPTKYVNDPAWTNLYTREYYRCEPDAENLPEQIDGPLEKLMDGTQFSVHLSRLHKTLRDELGVHAAPYLIDDSGKRPRQYRCTLPAQAIRFAPLPQPEQITPKRRAQKD
jgi:CRISPR-associated protein (TIGR02584 family)